MLWHWVIATASPRMTAEDTLQSEPSAFENAMFHDSFDGIR